MIDLWQLQVSPQGHTHTHTGIHSLVICLSTDAVDEPFVGDDSMAVDLQRKLFGLAPFQLSECT